MTDRRTFLKKAGIAAATAVAAPIAANAMGMAPKNGKDLRLKADESINSRLIVPHGNALPITGTFLDEISHDIPHQNWGEKEWDLDFRYMKAMGIDTVIDIRCGYRKFITYPSPYLLKKGCYMPSTDMIDMFCRLAQKYGMKFWLGLYDSGKYWDTGDMSYEVEANKYVIDEIWQLIGAGSNRMAAEFCLEIFKVIRGFGGAAISATQDLSDFFGLEDGRYGRAIINNSKNKIILNLEPDEAEFVRDTLKLTKTEIRSITRFERGEALICSNNSKVPVIIKASKEEQEMITTDRAELEAILKERQQEAN